METVDEVVDPEYEEYERLFVDEEEPNENRGGSQEQVIDEEALGPIKPILLGSNVNNVIMEYGVVPPPFSTVTEASVNSNSFDDWVPGDVRRGPGELLVKDYIRYAEPTADIKLAFDEGFMNVIPAIIEGSHLTFKDSTTVNFGNTSILTPHYSYGTRECRLLPGNAIRKGLTYQFNLICSAAHIRTHPNGHREFMAHPVDRVHIADIPLMLGTQYCYLRDMSPIKREEYLGDRYDPLGYFIVGGVERVIIFQEHMAHNRMFVFRGNDKNPSECRITMRTKRASVQARMVLGNTNKRIKMPIPALGHKREVKSEIDVDVRTKANTGRRAKFRSINPLSIFRIMNPGWTEHDIANFIRSFIVEKHRDRAMEQLAATVRHLDFINDAGNDLIYIGRRLNMEVNTPEQQMAVANRFAQIFDEELFPSMPEFPLETKRLLKLYNVAAMMAQLLELMAGVREPVNMDSWSVKKVEHADQLMCMLLRASWKKFITSIQTDINEDRVRDFAGVIAKFRSSQNKITKIFHTSFVTNKWGADDTFAKENVCQPLKNETNGNIISRLGMLRRVDVEVKRTGQTEMRMGRQTQSYFICYAKTPDGANVGIVKALASTTFMTIDVSPGPIVTLLMFPGVGEPLVRYVPDQVRQTWTWLNGLFVGWCSGKVVYDFLIQQKRRGIIDAHTGIILDTSNNLYIHTDGSRLVRPVLVTGDDGILEIDRKRPELGGKTLRGLPFVELLRKGAVQWISPFEQDYLRVATTPIDVEFRYNSITEGRDRLAKIDEQVSELQLTGGTIKQLKVTSEGISTRQLNVEALMEQRDIIIQRITKIENEGNYGYCELHPQALFGISGNMMPWPETNAGPRITFTSNNVEQAVSVTHLHQSERGDSKSRILAWPSERMTTSLMSEVTGADKIGFGQMVMTWVMCDPWTIEDSGKMSKSAVELGLMRSFTSITKVVTLQSDTYYNETVFRFEAPRPDLAPKYAKVDENGYPFMYEYYSTGDVLLGKKQRNRATDEIRDVSYRLGIGEEGYLTNFITIREGKTFTFKITLTMQYQPIEGDKFAPLYAQKLTIGRFTPKEDLPFATDGSTPDLIINPHSIPGRQTMGPLLEGLASKAAAMSGERVNATAFEKYDMDKINAIFHRYGMQEGGMEIVRSGLTGELLKARIQAFPMYYVKLPHEAQSKIQGRSGHGPINQINRQPLRGRKRFGAPRKGEMEERGIGAHGAAFTLQEAYRDVSDAYHSIYCYRCHTEAHSRDEQGKYLCIRKGCPGLFGRRTMPFSYVIAKRFMECMGLMMQCRMMVSELFRESFADRIKRELDKELGEMEEEEGDVVEEDVFEQPEEYIDAEYEYEDTD